VTLALVLIGGGVLVAFLAFIFAFFSIHWASDDPGMATIAVFRFCWAIVVMAFGGLVTFIGIIILVANILGQYGLL
jgi:hypothetical protein